MLRAVVLCMISSEAKSSVVQLQDLIKVVHVQWGQSATVAWS